jgi:uracil-DNA glycosylase
MSLEKTKALREAVAKLGRKYVGFRGDPHNPIWFIGEAPGADEDQLGTPFVGYSGKELDRMIGEAGIDAKLCCFTNPYKVRPPLNDIERIEETGITRRIFEEQFFEELNFYKPVIIVACGGTPLSILCEATKDKRDREARISKWRGSLLRGDMLPWEHFVIPCFHPAYILREWSDRDVAVFILRRVQEEYAYYAVNKKLQLLPERQLIANPTFGEAEEYLNECLHHKGPISTDIELLARRVPICCGYSFARDHAISISYLDGCPDNLVRLWRLMDRIHREKDIVGQNWTTFDSNWIEALGLDGGIRAVHDTLVRHHVLHPEMSHKLDFQIMQYTRLPYYKDEGRGWTFKDGMQKLKRYNCLDACGTLEVYEEQEAEFAENPSLRTFYESYEMLLARAFHDVDKRGIYTDEHALRSLRIEVVKELDEKSVEISKNLGGRPTVYSAQMGTKLAKALGVPSASIFNTSSVKQLKDILHELKIKLKVKRETRRETTNDDSLNEAFATTGNPILKNILRIRELNKVLGTYIDSKYEANIFYSCYSVTGTVTGRRASRKNFLGYGSNGQNQPKHSDLGEKFQGIFIARPGFVLISVDQASAEEWVVQGIIADVSGDQKGINELYDSIATGISRHARLASAIFGLPLERTNNKECLEYYVGKKVRHAGNYDMQADKMAVVMASEGFPTNRQFCDGVLKRFHEVEPGIRGVFHKFIQTELCKHRVLRTPLGRERVFHGLRPYGDNGKIFREGYAYIPQSTIGDNNGMAILYCEQRSPGLVLADGHDSVLLEVPDSYDSVLESCALLTRAYDRTLYFPNGFAVKIPIDFKIGYSMKGLKKCPGDSNPTGLKAIYDTLKEQQNLLRSTTGGQQLQSLQQASNETSGSIEKPGSVILTSTPSLSDGRV